MIAPRKVIFPRGKERSGEKCFNTYQQWIRLTLYIREKSGWSRALSRLPVGLLPQPKTFCSIAGVRYMSLAVVPGTYSKPIVCRKDTHKLWRSLDFRLSTVHWSSGWKSQGSPVNDFIPACRLRNALADLDTGDVIARGCYCIIIQ